MKKEKKAAPAKKAVNKVFSEEELFFLAKKKKSVMIKGFSKRHIPAAFVINMAFSQIHRLLKSGAISEYIPKR